MSLKQYGLHSKSALLKPLKPSHKCINFRQMVKHRNPANGIAPIPIPQIHATVGGSLRVSQHNLTQAHLLHSQNSSPIKQYVKDHITKKPHPMPSSRRSNRSQISRIDRQSYLESRMHETSRLELGLVDSRVARSGCTLEELNKKVQHLIELNLERCRIIQGKGELQNWVSNKKAQELENELLQIQEALKCAKQEEDTLPQIIAKIEMIQQTLALQACESDSLKKNYFGKKNQFFNTASHLNKHALKQSLVLNAKYTTQYKATSSPKEYLQKCASTTNALYKMPKRQFYVPPVKNNKKYQPNRTKILQSSYSAQFLHHKSALTFPSQQPFRRPLPETSLTVTNSTYQNQFGDKSNEVKQIDYKELDCIRNKIKNIDISFTESCKKPEFAQMVKQPKRKVEKQNRNCSPTFSFKSGMINMEDFFRTQQQKQFIDPKSDKQGTYMLKASPKNRQLLMLKQNFRMLAQGV